MSRNISCAELIPRMICEVSWYKINLGQWALSNLCIIKILNEGLRNFERMRTASSFYSPESIALNAVGTISINREVQYPPKPLRIFSCLRETGFPTVWRVDAHYRQKGKTVLSYVRDWKRDWLIYSLFPPVVICKLLFSSKDKLLAKMPHDSKGDPRGKIGCLLLGRSHRILFVIKAKWMPFKYLCFTLIILSFYLCFFFWVHENTFFRLR